MSNSEILYREVREKLDNLLSAFEFGPILEPLIRAALWAAVVVQVRIIIGVDLNDVEREIIERQGNNNI